MTDTTTLPAPTPATSVPESLSIPPPAAPPAAPQQPSPESATAAESETLKPAGGDEGEPSKKPRPASERIATLYAQKRQAEAEAQVARMEAERLRADLARLTQQPIENLPYEQQEAGRLRQVVKEARFEEVATQAQAAYARAQQARSEAFVAKVDAVRDRMPDFDQVFWSVPLSEAAADVLVESEHAAEIAYYLGKNPTVAAEIHRLPAHMQGARIAQIEGRVAVPQRKLSSAPPPVPQVAGTSAPAARDPANMSMNEFAEWWNKRRA